MDDGKGKPRDLQSGQRSKSTGTECGWTDLDSDWISREGPGQKWVFPLLPLPSPHRQYTKPNRWYAVSVKAIESIGSARKQNTCYFNRERMFSSICITGKLTEKQILGPT